MEHPLNARHLPGPHLYASWLHSVLTAALKPKHREAHFTDKKAEVWRGQVSVIWCQDWSRVYPELKNALDPPCCGEAWACPHYLPPAQTWAQVMSLYEHRRPGAGGQSATALPQHLVHPTLTHTCLGQKLASEQVTNILP